MGKSTRYPYEPIMKTDELREKYLAFFESKGCTRRPSDVLVPRGDPSVLFTPAGMNQFKDQFLGKGDLSCRRAVSCQKCLRTDDIDEVGLTPCHHTFFEMLGNFSFGDYFKKGAIEWAWEFVAGRLKIDPDRLYVSIYKDDAESYDVWHNVVGLEPGRICKLGEHDNYWPADAPTKSPAGTLCGPCTEIFVDMGPQPHCPDPATCDVTCDCKRYVEIWNLVLQQFEKGEVPGDLRPLPMQNIDTGMGLERTAAVLQGVMSNFEIDIFKPIVRAVAEALEVKVDPSDSKIRHVRRIADHARGVAFCIAGGVLPSNEGRGYVVRRLIRRAMRDGLELGSAEPFIYSLVPVVAKVMSDAYPELAERRENIAGIIKAEEERFQTTLENGSRLLKELVADLRSKGLTVLPGVEAFRLYDTYGLPFELTESVLAESGMTTDCEGFEREMTRQRAQARGASSMMGDAFDTGPLGHVKDLAKPTEFVGHESTSCKAAVAAIMAGDELADAAEAGAEVTIVLDETPFYGEAGGQVGDTGTLVSSSGKVDVLDTLRTHGYFLHVGKVIGGRIEKGQAVTCEVDVVRRQAIRRAHTATHLLQNALRTVLGVHVEQAGSLVAPDRLRFDFSHHSAVTAGEIERVEEIVNENILGDARVTVVEMPVAEAKASGAIALFGEKYGDVVRVVKIGGYSVELCGGTHLDNVSQAGLFRIVSESSVAAGTRRLEAVTGREAIEHGRRRERTLERVASILGTDEARVVDRAEKLLADTRELKAEIKKLKKRGAGESAGDIAAGAVAAGGVKLIVHKSGRKMDDLRQLCDVLKRKLESGVVVLASGAGGKLSLVVGVTNDLTPGVHAGKIIKDIASLIGGGGGGRPDMAQAGGKDPSKIDDLLAAAPDIVRQHVEKNQ
ncbi:MAG: alanine--tRNA ligase [Planctomycetota bacterium]